MAKSPLATAGDTRDAGLTPGLGRSPWRRKWQPTPVFLAWKIPWTEEPGGLQSTKSKRVGHDRALDSVFVYKHIKHY